MSQTIRLYELTPRAIYHNITGAFIDVRGEYFKKDCICKFGNVSSPDSRFINSENLKCMVPSLEIKDRFVQNRTIKGYMSEVFVVCP
jgi:hypothetical protein